ncbi:transporter substrate-binding domain-containing protein [Psychrosphaera sp. B3R10]|uniref:substrate-binding periplasmic protein n=1 Tax=unclassified Psychrosphaera TaxID=2641570 RepID=UPI001C081BD5|nr:MULTISPECIES: transporter substrate-binding domain-containing protein [unclassified Psychrosphaera]MBU2880638.1 transporter substrate-binding domain-containing protein [Psychrosphaera sp. I2R16]MBU2990724.1 transporter substrate-binding domain-containing protein [Psychrosphaera sp. B3R10]
MKLLFVTLLILPSCFSAASNAQEKISIALTHIPNVMEYNNDKAPYNLLVKHLVKKIDFDLELNYMPSSRSNKKLQDRSVDCIFPTIPTASRSIPTQLSSKVNSISAYIFTIGPERYTKLSQLHNKLVVHQRGYLFGDYITEQKHINFFPVVSQQAAIGMLQKKRAAALIDYLPDLRFILTKKQMSKLNYEELSPLLQSFDYFECIVNPRVDSFVKELNNTLEVMKKSGELEEVLGLYYLSTESQLKQDQ